MRTSFTLLFSVLFAAVGCGPPPPQKAPPPPQNGFQLTAGPYTVKPGEEKYFCYATTLNEPSQIGAIKFTPFQGRGTHHMVAFRTTAPEPEGFSECPVLVRQTWVPLWTGGVGTPGFTLPDGSAFKMSGKTQILIQLHLLNATKEAITDQGFLNIDTAVDPSTLQSASILALGDERFTLTPNTPNQTSTMTCTADHDWHLFAVFPHMHQLGTKITLDHGATEATATQVYAKDPWVFGDQPMDPFPVDIKKGDFLRTTCTWNNTTDRSVAFGESSLDEMCFFVMFGYPADFPEGCVEFPQ